MPVNDRNPQQLNPLMNATFANKLTRLPRLIWRGVPLLLFRPRNALALLRLTLGAIEVSLRMKREPLVAVLQRFSPPPPVVADPAVKPAQLANWLDRILSQNIWVLTPICWKRSIVLHRTLAQAGIATQIVFGVRRGGNANQAAATALDGHAWLECDGLPILESVKPDYVVTYRFPPAPNDKPSR